MVQLYHRLLTPGSTLLDKKCSLADIETLLLHTPCFMAAHIALWHVMSACFGNTTRCNSSAAWAGAKGDEVSDVGEVRTRMRLFVFITVILTVWR